MTYVVEVTQDFKQWGELETIKGISKQVKFTDPRQPLVPFKQNFYRVKSGRVTSSANTAARRVKN